MFGRELFTGGAITENEQLMLRRVLRCRIRAQRYVTVLTMLLGFFLGAGLLVFAVVERNELVLGAAVYTLVLAPTMAITRLYMLRLYEIIQKLWLELEANKTIGE